MTNADSVRLRVEIKIVCRLCSSSYVVMRSGDGDGVRVFVVSDQGGGGTQIQGLHTHISTPT